MKFYREQLQDNAPEGTVIPEQLNVTPQEAADILKVPDTFNTLDELKEYIHNEFPKHPEIWWLELETEPAYYVMDAPTLAQMAERIRNNEWRNNDKRDEFYDNDEYFFQLKKKDYWKELSELEKGQLFEWGCLQRAKEDVKDWEAVEDVYRTFGNYYVIVLKKGTGATERQMAYLDALLGVKVEGLKIDKTTASQLIDRAKTNRGSDLIYRNGI